MIPFPSSSPASGMGDDMAKILLEESSEMKPTVGKGLDVISGMKDWNEIDDVLAFVLVDTALKGRTGVGIVV